MKDKTWISHVSFPLLPRSLWRVLTTTQISLGLDMSQMLVFFCTLVDRLWIVNEPLVREIAEEIKKHD